MKQAVEAIDTHRPDYILILPWNLKDEIVAQVYEDTTGLRPGVEVRGTGNLLGIRVGLKSVPGRGSCFELWVPLASTEP